MSELDFSEVQKKVSTELRIQGKSEKTVRNYLFYNKSLLIFAKKPYQEIDSDDIKQYLAHMITERRNDPATVALGRSALAFYYDTILKKGLLTGIKTPKKQRKLPDILSKPEIETLLECAPSQLAKLAIQFMYASGLRVSEVAGLSWENINLQEKIGRIEKGKGGKDRLFIISEKQAKDLTEYKQKISDESKYIFQGKASRITTRSMQRWLKTAALRAGIKKKVYPHLLRHSFATHLIESGTDVRIIQELLAHSNLQTTQFYTHVSTKMLKSVKSPLD